MLYFLTSGEYSIDFMGASGVGYYKIKGFPSDSVVKNLPSMQEMQVQSLCGEDPLEEGMVALATQCSILAGESHAQKSLAGYSPWGLKELNTTEAT